MLNSGRTKYGHKTVVLITDGVFSGESQVYTVGHIGSHTVVSSKLSRVTSGIGASTGSISDGPYHVQALIGKCTIASSMLSPRSAITRAQAKAASL